MIKEAVIISTLCLNNNFYTCHEHPLFHRFGQAKLADGGLILASSKFTQLPQLLFEMMLNLKKVKINSNIIILLCQSKSVTHSEE